MNIRICMAVAALSLIAVPEMVCGQLFVPPGSGRQFRQFPQVNPNQNGNTQLLQQLQFQQQQLFNQQALQRSGIGANNQGAVSTTGHPTFFNSLGSYFNSGLNSGGGSATPGTTGQPFFNRNLTTNPFSGGGSGPNIYFGIGR